MKISIVSCAAWVPQGQAKANPKKVEVDAEDLKRIINETQNQLSSVSLDDDDDSDSEDEKVQDSKNQNVQKTQNISQDSMEIDEEKENEEKDIDKLYAFDKYDEEEEADIGQVAALSRLIVYPKASEDPLLDDEAKTAREEDERSESENHMILPNDNLIAVGHVEDDAAILEVYVYNESGDALYVHHDNLLPTMPICMEWLNYNPSDPAKPGNYVAVGTMEPTIEVWDLDLIDGLEPVYKLKRKSSAAKAAEKSAKGKVKSKKKAKKVNGAVMTLAWNKYFTHVLASGSEDGVICLWDLEEMKVSQTIESCSGRVQSLQWLPLQDSCTLLAGTSTGGVHVIDGKDRTDRKWQLQGEIEKVIWVNKDDTKTGYCIMASNNEGLLYCIDADNEEPLWSVKVHEQACSGLQINSTCPGLLVTGSEDGKMRVWDTLAQDGNTLSNTPKMIVELKPQVGRIHCLSAAIEHPFVFCIGGDLGDNCFKVWDIRASREVRRVFCPRLGLPVDEDGIDSIRLDQQQEEREDINTRFFGGQEQKPQRNNAGSGAAINGRITKRKYAK